MATENGETRVLFINHSVRDGGPGRSLFYILKHLDRRAVRPFVLIPRDDIFSERLKEESIYRDVIVDSRFPDGLLRPCLRGILPEPKKNSGFLLTALLKIVYASVNIARIAALIFTFGKVLREHNLDLIHCNGTIAKITGAFIGLFHGRPVVWHVRNIQQTRFLSFIITRLARLGAVKKIICVSRATAVQFGNNPKVCVIHNGIDPEDFDPERVEKGAMRKEFGIPEGTIVIGNAGRVVPRKGYGHMIGVAEKVLKSEKRGGGEKLKFVIVGDTPGFFAKNHLAELKNEVEKKGLTDSFIFTGFRKDVAGCMADFDIFLMPSNYPDPFPRAVIEAMSLAIPVLGFKVGGIEESVEQGVTGMLSLPADKGGSSPEDEMAAHLEILLDDANLRNTMGTAARERVIKLYSARLKTAEIQSVLLEAAV